MGKKLLYCILTGFLFYFYPAHGVLAQIKLRFPIQVKINPEQPRAQDEVEVIAEINESEVSGHEDTKSFIATLYYSTDAGSHFQTLVMQSVSGKKHTLTYSAKIPPQEAGKEVDYFVSWSTSKPDEILYAFFEPSSYYELYCQEQLLENYNTENFIIHNQTVFASFDSETGKEGAFSSAGVHCDKKNLYLFVTLRENVDKKKLRFIGANIVNPDYKEPTSSFLLRGFMAAYSTQSNTLHFTIDYPRELPPLYPECGFYQVASFKKGPLKTEGFECILNGSTLVFKIPFNVLGENPSKILQIIVGGGSENLSGEMNSYLLNFNYHSYTVEK